MYCFSAAGSLLRHLLLLLLLSARFVANGIGHCITTAA
jgi:hypothetical protein